MLCPECGKRPVTVHFTKIVNGIKSEFHLCEVCAREKGEYMPGFGFDGGFGGFSFNQLLSSFLHFDAPEPSPFRMKVNRCPTCGMTYQQFSQTGRFGCSNCFATFKDRLEPLLRRIHGHTTHRGKIPEKTRGALKIHRQIELLREELARKIEAEEYEEAAKIRDQIRELEERL